VETERQVGQGPGHRSGAELFQDDGAVERPAHHARGEAEGEGECWKD